MSQKSKKYARDLRRRQERLAAHMAITEAKLNRLEMVFDAVHTQAIADADRERLTARRNVRQAERKARTWKYIAYAALVAAIIVEIIAIWAVRFKEPKVPPLVIQPEQTVAITADEPKAGVPIAQLLNWEGTV